jgi:hypothetical protein
MVADFMKSLEKGYLCWYSSSTDVFGEVECSAMKKILFT